MSVHNYTAPQAASWATTPDAVGSHLLSFSGETNYALVSKRFSAFHKEAQTRVEYNKVAKLYTVQVLFPEFAVKNQVSAGDFAELNQRVHHLFSLWPNGNEEYRRVSEEFSHVDKTLSLERFEALTDSLSSLVLTVPQSNGTTTWKKTSLKVFLLLAAVFVTLFALFPAFPFVGVPALILLLLGLKTLKERADYKNNQLFNTVNQALNGHFAEAQERLSASNA